MDSSELIFFMFLVFIFMIILAIVLFFALRNYNCWYWKINERCDLLEKIYAELQILNGHETKIDGSERKGFNDKVSDDSENKKKRSEIQEKIDYDKIPKEKYLQIYESANNDEKNILESNYFLRNGFYWIKGNANEDDKTFLSTYIYNILEQM